MKSSGGPIDGVLVVDKPQGITSHDVVSRVRRALGTREVGHAGTLDPMATGVLVVLVGEATKLCAYITADDKEYSACLKLGVQTDSLDADGTIVANAPVPVLSVAEVERVFGTFVGTQMQRAPVVSAIKRDGVALHERVRRGENVEAPLREVTLHQAHVEALRADEIDFSITCGKGYYVRSLGRDVALALGTLGHLTRLRRTRVGTFTLGVAVDGALLERASRRETDAQDALRARMAGLRAACLCLPAVVLTELGVLHARQGKRIGPELVRADVSGLSDAAPRLLVSESDEPIAIAHSQEGTLRVLRGFQSRAGVLGTSST